MRRAILAGVAALTIAVGVPLAATAGDEKRLVITERNQLTSFDPATGEGTQTGTFVAAGAVNDAGTVTVTFQVVPGTGGCGVLTGPHTFTSSVGTITVFTRAEVCPFPPPTTPRSFARGQWEVVGATGAYAGLTGHGEIDATADFITGEITISRDGKVHEE